MVKKNRFHKATLAESKFAIGFGVGAVLLMVGIFYLALHTQPDDSDHPDSRQVPVYFERSEDATPFPPTLDPAEFKPGSVREAYQVAKEIPEVLVQQPCYCYCQYQGHRSLLDCYRTGHAASCDICTKEALLAGRMHHEGKPPEQIRTAIIHGQ
jgi:hypothetical protein